MLRLDGQTAIVAGGGGEIGAAAALILARQGATVCVADLDGESAQRACDRLVGEGGHAEAVELDLCNRVAVEGFIQAAMGRHGSIDIAVNTVGWTNATEFIQEEPEYWIRVIDVNLMSCVHLSSAVLPHMRQAEYGRLIFTSSLAGRIGRRGRVLYSAAKAGIIGFTKALALEEAPFEITVNCISPGATDTALMRAQGERNTELALEGIPRGSFAMPTDQGFGIAFLASREAAHITGQTLAIDGGATMV